MTVLAAEMTGKGTGAISTIGVFGAGAGAILKTIFTPAGKEKAFLEPASVSVGIIADGTETIDEVVVGCESRDSFAIHCHGNPLIVEMIIQLLVQRGAEIVTSRRLLAEIAVAAGVDTIAVEARLRQIDAKTLEGTKILENQVRGGLSEKAGEWLGSG